MDFVAVVDQVIALLRQRGRVTYRTLQLQFTLDDAQLAALKDELLYSQPHVVDDAGRGLVWTGDTGATPALAPSSQPSPPSVLTHAQTAQDARPAADQAAPEAERRQLTVLFCDLVDSTALSSQLDPEDLREVIRAYQATCAAMIERFEGHIAQYLGDGLLVYFGYPQAHEDDAQRAVRAGLGIVGALHTLNTRLEQRHGVRVAVRLGIHTGLVVVGEVGSGGRHEQLAMGETPNLAARLQGLAAPDTVAISAATFRLVQGYFTAEPLGVHTLKGIAAPVPLYCILGESGVQSRLDAVTPSRLTPLVGRDEEVALLRRRWEQATMGMGQVVLIRGEAGIGKSRLVQALKEHMAAEPHARIEWRGSSYHQQSALYSVIDHLHRLLRWHHDDPPAETLRTLEATLAAAGMALSEAVPLLAALLSLPLPASYPPLTLTPQRQRQQTLDLLLAWLHAEARRQPVLCVVEDLHWVDPSTLELLSLLIDQSAQVRLCLVLTTRPEFPPPWPMVAYLTTLTLQRFAPAQVERVAMHMAGDKALPSAVLQELVRKTDGVPLFVEELTKTVLESGLLEEQADRYTLHGPLPPLAIPSTLHDALLARLDRLAAAKVVAQLGATIGRTFAYEVVQAVAPLDVSTLQGALAQLVEAEVVAQRGLPPQATYTFKHALIQDAAYQTLLRSTRQQYHQRIAQVLEGQFPETTATQPELLAHHYTEAGLAEQAMPYWQHAGQRAVERSAHVEAIAHLSKGLTLVKQLPDTPNRIQHELTSLITLGPALIAHKGQTSAEVEHAYTRAHELCRLVDEPSQLFPVLRGLWIYYNSRGQFQTGHELGEQLFTLAQRTQDAGFLLEAHRTLGTTLFFLGEFVPALDHCIQNIARYDIEQHRVLAARSGQDPGVASLTYASCSLWLLGYPDQALTRHHKALTLARQVSHIYSLGFALCWATVFRHCLQQREAVEEQATLLMTLCIEHELPLYLAFGTTVHGRALAAQGQSTQGITQMHHGITSWHSIGAEMVRPYMLALLAEVYGEVGQLQEGLVVLTEAMSLVDEKGERWWEAELYRLKGKLLLALSPNNEAEVEVCFHQARTIAHRQQAKSLELRAAMSLARLWQQQGKPAAARDLLAPIYGWFTEGFDTADLQEARVLLDELA